MITEDANMSSKLTDPIHLESWFLLTTRFQRQSIRCAIPKSRQPCFFFFSFFSFFFLSTAYEFCLKLQIASWLAVVQSRNSSSHSLGTSLHPRPPRHSRLSDVRNRERLKHKGFSETYRPISQLMPWNKRVNELGHP